MADQALKPPLLPLVERFHGRPATSEHGLVYTFDGAVRAVECALALRDLERCRCALSSTPARYGSAPAASKGDRWASPPPSWGRRLRM